MRPDQGVDVDALARVLAVPVLPESTQRLALQEGGNQEDEGEDGVDGLGRPDPPVKAASAGKQPQVQEADGHADRAESDDVQTLEYEEEEEEEVDLVE